MRQNKLRNGLVRILEVLGVPKRVGKRMVVNLTDRQVETTLRSIQRKTYEKMGL
jgi:hypothetical protein